MAWLPRLCATYGRLLLTLVGLVFIAWLQCGALPEGAGTGTRGGAGVLAPSSSSSSSSPRRDTEGPFPSNKAYFFSFANGVYKQALARISREAQATGSFEEVFAYSLDDIPEDYKKAHADTFAAERGSGYWLWKPYLTARLFERMEYGDVVMYADAGCEFTGNPDAYIDLARKYGFVGFKLPLLMHSIKIWTKGDIFDAAEVDMDTFGPERQHVGGIWLLQKTRRNELFLKEWLRLSENHQLISDTPSIAPNHPDFKENRHDQAIYSLLVYKHGLQLVLEDRTFPRENSPVIHAARRRD